MQQANPTTSNLNLGERRELVLLTSLVDNVIATVNVKCLACDELCPVHAEEGHGDAHVFDRNETARRRLRLSLLQELIESRLFLKLHGSSGDRGKLREP
jgi:hypothetical protein